MKRWVRVMVAGATLAAVWSKGSAAGARAVCAPVGEQPFAGISVPGNGLGSIAEGIHGSLLLPFIAFDGPALPSGSFETLRWEPAQARWMRARVGAFHGATGVPQFVSWRGHWHGFVNASLAPGEPQAPRMYVEGMGGAFGAPLSIHGLSAQGEIDSVSKSQDEDRLALTGRDFAGEAYVSVLAEKIGDADWSVERIERADGQPLEAGATTLIAYDRGHRPWLGYEPLTASVRDGLRLLTRDAQGWSSISVAAASPDARPVGLAGAYLPAREGISPVERFALAWTERDGRGGYAVKAALADLDSRKLGPVQLLAKGIAPGSAVAPQASVAFARDGSRGAVTIAVPGRSGAWISRWDGQSFGAARRIAERLGRAARGFAQPLFPGCGGAYLATGGAAARELRVSALGD